MKTMYDDKLDGRITGEFYDEKVSTFGIERETLTESLRKLNNENTEYYKVGYAIHELALLAGSIYKCEDATVEERRFLLAYAFADISVIKGVITPKYTKPFKFLADWMPKVNKHADILEPMQKTAKTYSLSGHLQVPYSDFSIRVSESRDHSRTSKNPLVNARQRHSIPLSRTLLRRQDSNLRPID